MEWSMDNLPALSAIAAVVIPTVIQVSPIKINPWTWVAKKIGRAINGEVLEQVEKMDGKLDEHISADEESKAIARRMRILRFNDEIMRHVNHSKEHYDQLMQDIKKYDTYCESHKDFENGVTGPAAANIARAYARHLEKNDFLE